jgi:hypothetical protein
MSTTNFAKLDFKTIAPYFGKIKTICYIAAICVFVFLIEITFKTHIPFFTLSLFGVVIIMVDIFPFLLEMKNELNAFYVTQNIPRETVVKGRYLYALTLNIITVDIACAIDIAVLIAQGNFPGIISELTNGAAVLLIMQLYISISYPLYFKMGYAKGSSFASILPLIIIGVPFLFIGLLSMNGLITLADKVSIGTDMILLGTTIICTSISMKLSTKFYKKREF